jgi:YidC/Oxa1 family membrane protein insertase
MIQAFQAFEHALYRMLEFYQSLTAPLLGANSYWVAIVLMTLTVRVALLPLVMKQVRSMRAMRALQPQLKAIRDRHGKDQAKVLEESTRLTREHGVNPLAGCLPMLAQAPVFIALSRVILSPVIDGEPNVLRGHLALGVDLGTSWKALEWADRIGSTGGLMILALIVLAAITTTLTQRLSLAQQPTPIPDAQRRLLQVMPLLFPLMWIGFPLAAIMYWVTSNLWTLGQQWVVTRTNPALPALAASAGTAAQAMPKPARSGGKTRPGSNPPRARAGSEQASRSGARGTAGGGNGARGKRSKKRRKGQARRGATASGSGSGSGSGNT